MSGQEHRITVIGAGSWGTALAILLSRNGRTVTLWGRTEDGIADMGRARCNERYLPGIRFPDGLAVSDDLRQALDCADIVLLAVPSSAFRPVLEQIAPLLAAGQGLVWATKGLDHGSGRLLHQVVEEVCPRCGAYGVISGPTFATEVAQGLPTALTAAATDAALADGIARLLHNERFRVYTSDDIVGVELGGSVKNALAIAAGIADGLGFGANTRAALITRGLHEMMNLGLALGGRRETFMGLAGLGDLVLTCTDNQSRNRRFGTALGQGVGADQARERIGQVVEGVETARLVHRLAQQHGVEMPIVEQVYNVLFRERDLRDAVNSLFGRDLKAESTSF